MIIRAQSKPVPYWNQLRAQSKPVPYWNQYYTRKYISIAYCDVQWAVAAGIMVVVWIDNIVNITDTFTKSLSDMHRDKLFRYWTYEYLFIYCISKIEGTKKI